MFGIGLPEFIIIALLVVIVVGPEQLPDVMRKGVAFVREARRHLSEIKDAVDQQTASIKEPLQDIQKEIRNDFAESDLKETDEKSGTDRGDGKS